MDMVITRLRVGAVPLRTLARVSALLLPICLMYTRTGAEIAMGTVDICFLVHSARSRDWRWLRSPWVVIAACWWVWTMIASLPVPALGLGPGGWSSFAQAFVIFRLLLLAVALGSWVLDTPRDRTWFWLVLALCEFWIFLESWQQQLTGTNIFGDHRWGDHSLTGPFWAPRAGPPYSHLLFLSLLPVIGALLARPGLRNRIAAGLIGVLGFVTVVLIGQRMPFLLAGLGLIVTALAFRPVRLPAVVLGALVLLAIPALRVISPPSFDKLVLETARQVPHFAKSPYGELYTRATVMIEQAPGHGYGFNGFKRFCPESRFDRGLPALGIGPTSLSRGACNIHPHNFYLQAGVDSGLLGIALFAAMNLAWMITLGRSLVRRLEPLRLGVFIGVLTYAWPLASTDNFVVLPMAGWLFVMLGLGLALARVPSGPPEPRCLYPSRHDLSRRPEFPT